MCCKPEKTTSGSRLDAREVVVAADVSKHHIRLAFGREGGGGAGRCVASHVLQARKKPPLARVWMRGRWQWLQTCRTLAFGCEGGSGGRRCVESLKKTTSDSRLVAREVVVAADVSKHHLQLAFGCEGGGGGCRHVEPLRLDAREVVVAAYVLKARNKPPPTRVWL